MDSRLGCPAKAKPSASVGTDAFVRPASKARVTLHLVESTLAAPRWQCKVRPPTQNQLPLKPWKSGASEPRSTLPLDRALAPAREIETTREITSCGSFFQSKP